MRRALLIPLILIGASILQSCSSQASDVEAPNDSRQEIATVSETAGIPWILPAREIDGLTQRIVGEGLAASVVLTPVAGAASERIVVYLHGWQANPPWVYGDLMRELVTRGNTVVYPVYQERDTPLDELRENVALAISVAAEEISGQWEKFALVGDSTGGALAYDYAAMAGAEDLPQPALVVARNPGRNPGGVIPSADLSAISAGTGLLTATTADVRIPGSAALARMLLRQATAVAPPLKRLMLAIEARPGDVSATGQWQPILDQVDHWLKKR